MNEVQQVDIRSMNPDDRMERIHTAALLTHLNQSDARIQATKANVTIWHEALAGKRLGDVVKAAHDHLRRYDPKNPEHSALTIGVLSYLVREQVEHRQRVEAARKPLPPARSSGPPPHIAEKFAAYKDKYPRLLQGKKR